MEILQSRIEAIRLRDADKIALLVDKSRYTRFDDWPPYTRLAQDGLEHERAALKVLKKYVYRIEEPMVEVNGDTAWVTFYLSYAGRIRELDFAIKSRATVIMVRSEGGWRIVHEHYSRMPGLEPRELMEEAASKGLEPDLLEKRIIDTLSGGEALTAIEIAERISKSSGEKVEASEVAVKCRELVAANRLEKEGFIQPKYRLKRR